MNLDEGKLSAILRLLEERTPLDFSDYKLSTLERRLERRIQAFGFSSYREYFDFLDNPENEEAHDLAQELLVTVTSFFRDYEVFEDLRENIIPKIIFRKSTSGEEIRVWVPGCGTGQEVYSLAILFEEARKKANSSVSIKLIASDVKESMVEKARKGVYTEREMESLPEIYLRKYFRKVGNQYKVSNRLKEIIFFTYHDILNHPPFGKMDLISCRNLLIYLQKRGQQRVVNGFNFSLNFSGYLVLGRSESINATSTGFETYSVRNKIYRKILKSKSGESTGSRMVIPNIPHLSKEQDVSAETGEMFRKILDTEVLPAAIIVNESIEILYATESAYRYISVPEDYTRKASLLEKVSGSLKATFRTGLAKLRQETDSITYSNLEFTSTDGEDLILDICLKKGKLPYPSQGVYYAILINGNPQGGKHDFKGASGLNESIIDSLQASLEQAESDLRKTISELEGTNQNLMASNEELQSSNEEYLSVNEELQNINSEYQDTIQQLREAENDINHLLQSTEIGMVFLDMDFNIRQFTKNATNLVSVRESDIGRPFNELRLKFKDPDFDGSLKRVMESGKLEQKEIKDDEGKWFLLRVLPDKDAEGALKGIALNFIDIHAIKKTKVLLDEQKRLYTGLVDNSFDGILVFDMVNQKVKSLNAAMRDILGVENVSPGEMDIFSMVLEGPEGMEKRDDFFDHIREMMRTGERCNYTFSCAKISGEEFTVNATFQPVRLETGLHLLMTVKDISPLLKQEMKVRQTRANFESIFRNNPLGVSVTDMDYNLVDANDTFTSMLGYTSKEILKKNLVDFMFPEEIASIAGDIKKLKEGEISTLECEKYYIKKDGGSILVKININIIQRGDRKFFLANVTDVTQERKIQQEVLENEKRYRALFNNTDRGIVVISFKEYRAIDVNAKMEELLGDPREEILESSLPEQSPEMQAGGITSEELADKLMHRLKVREESFSHPWRFRRGDDVFEAMLTFSPIIIGGEKAGIMQVEDLSEAKAAEEALKQSEERYRLLADNMEDIISLHKTDGSYLYISPSISKAGGYALEEFEGKNPLDFIHPEDQGEYISNLTSLVKGKNPGPLRARYKMKDGSYVWLENITTPIFDNEGGKILMFQSSARDISKTIEAENKIKEQLRLLNDKNEELKRYIDSNMELESFAYVASHDLRQPLRSISGFTRLLQKRYNHLFDSDAKEFMDFVIKNVQGMSDLIEDLLMYSRVSTQDLETVEIDIESMVHELKEGFEISHGAEVNITVSEMPQNLLGNPIKIKQVFHNLLGNAIKFRKEGAPAVIFVSATEKKEHWEFRIEDQGIGIKKDYLERIFLIFKKLHNAGEYEGSGIGLAICKKIVEQHLGRISVESEFGKGTTFTFSIKKGLKKLG